MTETVKSPQELEKEFYSKPLYLSYSGLNKIVFSPKLYYKHYILQQREEKLDSYLIDGKVIHNLLLDDGSFEKNFILLPSTLPTGNSRLVIDKIFEKHKEHVLSSFGTIGTLDDFGKDILEILKQINLHQSLKTDAQRFAKIITEENISYFEFLKLKGSKDLIDSETLQRCNEAVDVLKNDSKVTDLLGTYRSEMENTKIYNELELSLESSVLGRAFGLKGIIDNIKVDYDNKTVYINDLKTTGKTISDFKETIEYYNYNLQAAIYHKLVKNMLKDIMNADWNIVFNFIVVDKYTQVYPFEVSKVTMAIWLDI
ncbi:MAG TPA: PD-(D/E)XK nuclease family protein, partial [Candidatus Dojkabacteria bacterium]|nr:PD-(D/E)XK nuclease family protein [Candidatus Dojkabacteria bacterium]